jgi:hypothetical protein
MRLRLLTAPLIAATLVLAGCTGGEEPAPHPEEIAAPAVSEGAVLGTWTGHGAGVTSPVDAEGRGLIVALDCVGSGSVEVGFSPGTVSRVMCHVDELTSDQNRIEMPHPEPMTLTVRASPNVSWGLTVAAIEF